MEVGGHFIAENVSTKDSLFTRKEAILKGKQKHNQLTMRRLPLNIKRWAWKTTCAHWTRTHLCNLFTVWSQSWLIRKCHQIWNNCLHCLINNDASLNILQSICRLFTFLCVHTELASLNQILTNMLSISSLTISMSLNLHYIILYFKFICIVNLLSIFYSSSTIIY